MGVDVESLEYVAQVKAVMANVGRPVIQQTFGVAAHRGKQALVFSLGGFTDDALKWAAEAGVGLFSFDLQGEPQPLNRVASLLSSSPLSAGGQSSRVLLADGAEAITWFQMRQDTISSQRTNVLLVGEWAQLDDLVSELSKLFQDVFALESEGVFAFESDDLAATLSNVQANGLLVIERLEQIRGADLVEMLVRAVKESQLGLVLGSGPTRQRIVVDLPEFSLVGSTREPGKLDRRLLELFDYWLIQ